jgi:hypothetical protein
MVHFDPADYSEHVGGGPPIKGKPCRICGGQGWLVGERGTDWCPVCSGTGQEPPPYNFWGCVLCGVIAGGCLIAAGILLAIEWMA